jgi:hypothetical protein
VRQFTMLIGALAIATSAAAQAFSLHIETPLSQSQFRIGEAIGLKLIFEMTHATDAASASQPGWMVTLYGHDRSVLGFGRDRFVVTPETGTLHPEPELRCARWTARGHSMDKIRTATVVSSYGSTTVSREGIHFDSASAPSAGSSHPSRQSPG